MNYQLTAQETICVLQGGIPVMFLPAENNGTPEWREYQAWLDAGNTPLPAPPPPPPGPDYPAFWDALITSSVYESIRTQSMASLAMNTLATEFIALITDAKIGRPNQVAIQNSINSIFGTGTFTNDDVEEFNNILNVGFIDNIYSLN
jgi:hypothetical protein